MFALRPRSAPAASILIVPIGGIDLDLESLRRQLEATFRCAVRVHAPCALPLGIEACDAAGRRDASKLMGRLGERFGSDGAKVIGITAEDLFVPGLSWVFGQAQVAGATAIVSMHRLAERFHGRAGDAGRERRRLLTELCHEVGHVFGLGHCLRSRCCMRRSADLAQIEAKGERLCASCAGELRRLHRASTPLGELSLMPSAATAT